MNRSECGVCLRMLGAAGWILCVQAIRTLCYGGRWWVGSLALHGRTHTHCRLWLSIFVVSCTSNEKAEGCVECERVSVCRKFTTFRKHNICITTNATSPAKRNKPQKKKRKKLSIVCLEFSSRFRKRSASDWVSVRVPHKVRASVRLVFVWCGGISIPAFSPAVESKMVCEITPIEYVTKSINDLSSARYILFISCNENEFSKTHSLRAACFDCTQSIFSLSSAYAEYYSDILAWYECMNNNAQ